MPKREGETAAHILRVHARRLMTIAAECRWDQLPALEDDVSGLLTRCATAGGKDPERDVELKNVVHAYETTLRGLAEACDALGRRMAQLNEMRDGWKAYQSISENDA